MDNNGKINGLKAARTRTGTCVLIAALALVAACGSITKSSDRVLFEGKYFRAKAKPVNKKKAPTDFTVVVNGVSESLDGAREAGRYEGTRYCIENFGSSRIAWKVGPDTEPQQLQISDNKLSFLGTCQRP